jgi:AraC family transcriptional regulator of adaptative response/methylated-DNA-[protein]-cysteine methyltransferase
LQGVRPTRTRTSGEGAPIRFSIGRCSLGGILVAASPRGVCAIFLGDDSRALAREVKRRFEGAEAAGADLEFERLAARAIDCVDSPGANTSLQLDIKGTAFQQRVWAALQGIAPGTTATYAEIASRVGNSGAARAVAGACAANHIAVAIPCHRVVRTGGALSGYRWGVERKKALLDKEARALTSPAFRA